MAKNNEQTRILECLGRIEARLTEQQEEFLSFNEGADFLGLSPSYLYKLTHQNSIPFYRPGGKKIYFKRSELEKWISEHRVSSIQELSESRA